MTHQQIQVPCFYQNSHVIVHSYSVQMYIHGGWEKQRGRIQIYDTYHDVAYRTNTLAAFPMADLASLEMLTFSGSCNQRGIC